MKLSTKTRYGTRLMVNLALNFGQKQLLLKDIAKTENISEKYLSQIIIPLKSSGLVKSFRGAHGGYVLSKPPKNISLKEIVVALDGPLDLVECIKDSSACERVSFCVTRNLWKELGETLEQTLASKSLADLVRECRLQEEETVLYNI
jgi:Rrf2 family cysteine metabolism transcriptional repressor